MKFHNGFVGENVTNKVLNFFGTDNIVTLNRNLETATNDWYYKDKEITYSLNDYGHRCKSIQDIDPDNYILFLGCSVTMGIGVELEKSFSYLIAQEKKCDYYNLSLVGTGLDILEHNLVNWFFTIKKKPKYVVLQYPESTRFVSKIPGFSDLLKCGVWLQTEEHKRFIINSDQSGYFLARSKIISNLINTIVDVPSIKINLGGFQKYDNGIICKHLDYARDLLHGGNKTNERVAEQVLDQMK